MGDIYVTICCMESSQTNADGLLVITREFLQIVESDLVRLDEELSGSQSAKSDRDSVQRRDHLGAIEERVR